MDSIINILALSLNYIAYYFYTLKYNPLPRPVFNLASGTSFIASTQEDYETSPVFPRRLEIIQSGFEKPKLSSRKYTNRILAEVPGAHGGSRDPYLRAEF